MSHSHILCIVVILGFFSCKEKNSIPAENIEAVATDSLAFQNYNKGIELASKYEFENALPYLLKSVDGFEKANNINSQVKALNRISLSYHDFGNYDKGIEYAYLAKKVLDEHPQQANKNLYWYVYNNAGINYDDSKRPQQAIEEHLKALPYAIDASDSSYSYNNLGNTYKKLNRLDKAETYFKLALTNPHSYKDDYHFATVYSNMVDIERLKKNYKQAQYYLDSALHYATISNSPEKLLDIYYYTYLLKSESGDHRSASGFLNKYVQLKDSLFTSEKNDALLHYQTKYETEKKEKQITEQKLVSKQKNLWLILMTITMSAGLLFFWYYRQKTNLEQKQLALENQLLQEQTHSKIQEQRLEISRELHDSLGSQLTFIKSVSDSLLNASEKSNNNLNARINTLSEFSENSIAELKNTIWALNSQQLNLSELKLKMLNFISSASEAKESMQFHFLFNIVSDYQLSSRQAINLFRVFQEILNNTIKYAEAKDVFIDISQIEKNLTIKISDNGIGFNFEEAKKKSFGLTNIQNRIEELKGKFSVETSEGNGTTYLIKLELDNNLNV
ncbi:MAG: sensor histidine kinase [Bacteroidetes bacterium]|nr:sensor histidine kinase [Bacteroidota bacterium]MCW5931857.1 tetratricopeptide repeat protein [Bacteroidota bacterium]HRV53154.1 ATP-binding protein [Bacteroidia bacterium]